MDCSSGNYCRHTQEDLLDVLEYKNDRWENLGESVTQELFSLFVSICALEIIWVIGCQAAC